MFLQSSPATLEDVKLGNEKEEKEDAEDKEDIFAGDLSLFFLLHCSDNLNTLRRVCILPAAVHKLQY